MQNIQQFRNLKVTVIGLGRSGVSSANLLYDLGAEVNVTDNQDNIAIHENVLKLKSKNIKVELGRHSEDFIKNKDLIVVSPGVPQDAYPIVLAEKLNIPVISEIEFAFLLCEGTIIAITGTNGKTTLTTLVGNLLNKVKRNCFICGNIGNPFSAEVRNIKESDFVSLEVSSFQLERIKTFKPKIAVILNFSCNHLDRYRNMEEYLNAKKRIFMNQDETDYLVLNEDDPVVKDLAKETKAKVVFFKEKDNLNSNYSALLAIGSILKIDKDICLQLIREFKGIEHRLEFVKELNHINFINDSKSTTVESTLWALRNIEEPVILIAGGKDKGIDYQPILALAKNKIKKTILIGEAKDKIEKVLKDSVVVQKALTLEEAVEEAYRSAVPGDCVLLSPMCASFDMFKDYEERGRAFKKAVYDLARRLL
ncbi:MAG: UDP-N-acetylmuramoyl-L-alanine--D-glutamate ligase [Candidatus Omnitrophica bacterium]|nr:UDP-N-acetylmuramoyl-L-alanine--D-glutamate ligase [Candidatus Omnitrophota bacterium]